MNESYTQAPHRRSPQQSGPSPNAALLIDFDNVTMAMRSNLGQELRNFLNSDIVRGKVSVQRAYADWRRYPQYIVPLAEASIDLIFAPAYGSSKKNATDIRLAIDALELVFTRPEIGTYLLLSGDSDFSSLVLKLKEYGKYVIGVGLQESTSDLLVQNCDEYYSYNTLSGLTSAEEMDTSSLGPWELVEKAVERMDERNDVMRSDRLKQVMLEFDSGFDEKDHGFSKFNRFLAEASSRGLVRLRKIGDGHYEVAPVERRDEDQAPDPSRPEPIETEEEPPEQAPAAAGGGRSGDGRKGDGRPRGGRRRARDGDAPGGGQDRGVEASSLRKAYDLLSGVVGDLSDGGGPVRDSEVKREILRRDGSFDEAALGFSKFSRFLRQAYDEGVVELTTDPDGNFHLQPAGAEPVTFEEPGPEREEPEPAGSGGGSGSAEGNAGAGEEAAPAEPAPRQQAPGAGAATGEAAAPSGGRREDAPDGAGREESPEPAEESRPETADAAASGPTDEERTSGEPSGAPAHGGRRRRGGLGRFRRGSRGGAREAGASEDGGEGAGVSVGPVDEPSGEGGAEDEDEASRDASTSATTEAGAGDGGGRRRSGGLGRFRRGQRSGGAERGDAASGDEGDGGGRATPGPVDAGGGEEPAPSGRSGDGAPGGRRDVSAGDGGSADAEIPVPDEAADDPVGYMVGHYPGVGSKTAEKLVEAFGESVFEVIDREPDRLTQVLPDHRARAVVEAREAERRRSAS